MAKNGRSDDKRQQVFKNGNLVRLYLRDFMTYKSVEMKSGPNLNLVLGPNGTGKSALVCSIIIGLGGDPSTTGRAGHLGEYIRFGCDSALVEIELFNENSNQNNFLIQRVIHSRQSKGKTEYTSSFKLNGKDSNRTNVREFIRSHNINVDNLCQFLPQERVIEFVKMDRKTLLECTEKAAGDENMFDSHQKMVELSKSIRKLNAINTDLNKQIATETELQTRAEEELRRIEERDRFKKDIEWLRKKKPWIEYEDKRIEYTNAKENVIHKKEELQELMKNLEPLKVEATTARNRLTKCQTDKINVSNELKKASKNIEPIKSKIENNFDSIKDLKSGYFEQVDTENRRKHKLRQLEAELNSFKDQFENINEDNTDIERQIKDVLEELNSINLEYTQQNQMKMKLKERFEKLSFEKTRFDTQRDGLEDVFRRRLNKLQQINQNAAKAYQWLSDNKSRFKKTIFPPIMTQININKIEWSKYVESAIPFNDLIAFVCESSDDLKLFTQLLKNELNIRVNVVLAPNQNEDDFEPNFNISQYSNYGLFSTIKDMFSAPNKVMAYLCKTNRLHLIPVGDKRTDEKFQNLIENSNFRRIFTDKNVYNINISRYDNKKVINTDAIRESNLLNLIVNESELQTIREKIKELEQNISEVRQKNAEIDHKLNELNTTSSTLKNRKKLLDNKKNEKRILETKIAEKKEQINRIESQAIRLEDIKRKIEVKLKKLEENQLISMEELTKTIIDCIKSNENKIKVFLCETLARKESEAAQRKFSLASDQFQGLKEEMRQLELSLDDLKREAKDLRNSAKHISGFDVNNCDEEVRQKFDSLPNTTDEIDNQIGTLTLRMNSILDADDSLRDTYNTRQKNIEKRRKDLESKAKELSTKQSNLEKLKTQWLPSLEELIDKLNTNFGNFMDRINCAGDVSIYKPEDPDSFDEYGISIKVKFRQSEQLRELTSFHQSGGERSVSTMIYMIALQELTYVPFRCVDEINQGMDETNERSVFDLISETSSRNNSQYFLFSPKLLPNLTYTDEMTVHIIFNGPYMEFDWNRVSNEDQESDDED